MSNVHDLQALADAISTVSRQKGISLAEAAAQIEVEMDGSQPAWLITVAIALAAGATRGSAMILVTGAAGYIGSHTVASLLTKGHSVVALDDLSRGHEDALRRAEQVAGARPLEAFELGDICDERFIHRVIDRWRPDAVVHLAGFKSVAESVVEPERYEAVNVGGTQRLADALATFGVRRVVYASTGSVYGEASAAPLTERAPIQPISPYAATKYRGEMVLASDALDVVALRFFNVCGAHPSGQLGEYVDRPQNLMPILLQAARKGRPITVFGTDYPTPDGTCVRDYIHVMDIVSGIEAALAAPPRSGIQAYNLGTGTGSSVLEVIAAAERAIGRRFEVVAGERRPGDPGTCVANALLARADLGWRPRYSLDEMAAHAWAWMVSRESSNQDGCSTSVFSPDGIREIPAPG